MTSNHIKAVATPTRSLNILVALSCEAKPIIDFYRLKKLASKGFAHFYQESNADRSYDINLVVSGIGSTNMLQASAWLAAKTEAAPCAWLNVGTAGHIDSSLGKLVQVVHSIETGSEKAHYPPLVVNLGKGHVAKGRGAKGLSVDRCSSEGVSLLSCKAPVSDYPANQAVDMEAYSFFLSAKRFASAEFVQSLKVISDNKEYGLELLSAARISELIAPQVTTIDEFAQSLIALVPQAQTHYQPSPQIAKLHCTVSQMTQYQDLMNKLDNMQIEQSVLENGLLGVSTMKEVLEKLRALQLTIAPALNAVNN